jgi:hypothetical protein
MHLFPLLTGLKPLQSAYSLRILMWRFRGGFVQMAPGCSEAVCHMFTHHFRRQATELVGPIDKASTHCV